LISWSIGLTNVPASSFLAGTGDEGNFIDSNKLSYSPTI